MPSHRLEDHETPTLEAAAGFERYHAEPDWDEGVKFSDVRLDRKDWQEYREDMRGDQ